MAELVTIPRTVTARIEAFVAPHMAHDNAHDYAHVDRVRRWAVAIARQEGYPRLDLAEVAALLHDVGLGQSSDRRDHGDMGAAMAAAVLRELDTFPEADIEEVTNAIRFHNRNREGEGRLLDILRDADMMEMFGAIGLLRALTFSPDIPAFDPDNPRGESWGMAAKDYDRRFDAGLGMGDTLVDHVNFHISCYDNLATATARQWAKPLVEYLREFVRQLEREACEGEHEACT